ncbi:MAG TPA: aminopeptidase P family protein [Bacteroidales bacterium]|nr:aminopeptidase P family protein [Bacteroidales bacterium]
MNPFAKKIALLRASMKENNLDAYIIPSTDPHLGEYVPDYWREIAWLTGFTGSAATVVVTDSFAGLWTDSRYFIQAENQLENTGCVLVKPALTEKKDYIEWLTCNMKAGSRAGIDGKIFSIARVRKIRKQLEEKKIFLDINCDLIAELWTDRPAVSDSMAFDHPVSFCGNDRSLKITEVRTKMKAMGVGYHLLTSPDDIMWLLNIRGNDVKYCPLLMSYAIVNEDQILLFVEESKIPMKLAMEFDRLGIVMLPYEETEGILTTLSSDLAILITPGTTSASMYNSIPAGMKIIEDISLPTRLKAIKNKTEIENISKVMVKDGVALTKFFYWFEQNADSVKMSELSISETLNKLRSEQENFLGPSFATITAYNEHGALPHYSATSETDYIIGSKGTLLIDSGGQYLDGTTDITRTIAIGRPTSQQKRDFTLVLKGNIALATAKFPSGTKGCQIDILARKALWDNGLHYGHGTGHGVGFCLNVHEGPQSISMGTGNDFKTTIEPGMLISDEPAIYREGEYGIRTENLLICYEDEETEFGQFLKFGTVSLCYIDKTLIDTDLLDQKEIDWLNSYHSEVYEKLCPHLSEDEKIWLKEKTESI